MQELPHAGRLHLNSNVMVKNNTSTRKHLLAAVVLISVSLATNSADCSEKYYINNNRVLLYKIINWWYDCLPEESNQLCGSVIRCRSENNFQIGYDAIEMKMKISAQQSFADLLSVFKPRGPCRGPSLIELKWLNKRYFDGGRYIASDGEEQFPNSFLFDQVDRIHADNIRSLADEIGLELEGAICGLMNGRIALHHSGEQLKTCPLDAKKQDEQSSISLKIVNFQTKEILARFSVFPDGIRP